MPTQTSKEAINFKVALCKAQIIDQMNTLKQGFISKALDPSKQDMLMLQQRIMQQSMHL